MRTKYVSLLLVMLATFALAEQSAIPQAPRSDDPYSIVATVTPAQLGFVTVRVTATEKKSGKRVFSPTVMLRTNTSAVAISDPDGKKPQFEVSVFVSQSGEAFVRFEAFDRLLQRSSVQAGQSR